ncbi:MAG: ribonuclease H-like domain-containing protein [Thermodesulfovibrionales bacterium]|nr:ribonuclease H-like domain-containing protein [Thermodesulfovibrionales bacterium]
MSRIIFDIETVGVDFDSLEPSTQEYLMKWAETEDEEERVRESLSFYPLTGEIITIGMLNPDSNKGVVYFQTPRDMLLPFEEDGIRFECGMEKEIIEKFWSTIKTCDRFVTFNGRSFDCPFIMIRSAVNRIKPTRDLMPNRYNGPHIDLLDQMTFYGASKRRFSLDMWCKTFNIKSPKSEGITGYDVKDLFKAGKHVDIARYCAGDLRATKELLLIWEDYIKFPR